MVTAVVTLDILLVVLTAAVYAAVGYVVGRRHIGGESQLAIDSFVVWWYGLAILNGFSVARRVLSLSGNRDISLHVALTYLTLLVLCVAIAGLLYYLVYLFTGSRRWFGPIITLYALYFVSIVYYVVWREPTAIDLGSAAAILYARESPAWADGVLTLVLVVPVIFGAVGYARLFFRVQEATQRYRIGIVSSTFILWFGTTLVGWATGLNDWVHWSVATRVVALLAALVILAAFRPPGFVRRRWGILAVDDPHTE